MTWKVGMAGFYVRRAGTTARPAPGSTVAGEPRMTDAAVFESAIHLYLPESNPENSTGKLLR